MLKELSSLDAPSTLGETKAAFRPQLDLGLLRTGSQTDHITSC